MDFKELQMFVDGLSNEKGISREIVVDALENAMAMSMRKNLEKDPYIDVRVELDEATERFRAYKVWAPEEHRVDADGDLLEPEEIDATLLQEEEIPIGALSRIAAQAAKQVIFQKVREAKRQQLAEDYQGRMGELFYAVVKRVTREHLVVEVSAGTEAVVPRDNLLPHEIYRVNDRIRAVLEEVRVQGKGNQLVLSRTSPQMLKALFSLEVPEISEQIIEIRAIAREPEQRAKIAVKTNDRRIDPVGACIGLRGSRVQLVSDEMGGEKIDIVEWSDNPAELVINAISPVEAVSIVVDEEVHCIDVSIKDENLAQAIGRNGQNVRLISEMIGWAINIMSEEEAAKKMAKEANNYKDDFQKHLGIDEGFAETLISLGFLTLDDLAYVPEEELTAIDGFDLELVQELQSRARASLITVGLEEIESQQPQEDILTLEGMSEELAQSLAKHGIVTRDDLAELAIDELIDFIPDFEPKEAGELIMKARAHWFDEET